MDSVPEELFLHILDQLPRTSSHSLSMISTRWRRIVLGMPTLWTYIHVSPTLTFEWLDILLTRSQSSLLTVDVQFSLIDEPLTQFTQKLDIMIELLGCLSSHMDRCRVFGITVDEPACWHQYPVDSLVGDLQKIRRRLLGTTVQQQLLPLSAARLERLYIKCPERVNLFRIFEGGMPALTHLYLDTDVCVPSMATNTERVWHTSKFLKRLNSITHLFMGDHELYVAASSETNSLCPNLHTLTWLSPPANGVRIDPQIPLVILGVRVSQGTPIIKFRIARANFETMEEWIRTEITGMCQVERVDAEEERREKQIEQM